VNAVIGRAPKLMMNIHNVSEVNNPSIHLSEIDGPADGSSFKNAGEHVKGAGESTQWGMKE
jgi:NADH-quinone oxidoreductase subunit G